MKSGAGIGWLIVIAAGVGYWLYRRHKGSGGFGYARREDAEAYFKTLSPSAQRTKAIYFNQPGGEFVGPGTYYIGDKSFDELQKQGYATKAESDASLWKTGTNRDAWDSIQSADGMWRPVQIMSIEEMWRRKMAGAAQPAVRQAPRPTFGAHR